MIAIGIIVLLLVTFAHPFEGNTYGFCPIFKSPLHAANDVVVAAIDITAAMARTNAASEFTAPP